MNITGALREDKSGEKWGMPFKKSHKQKVPDYVPVTPDNCPILQ